MKNLFSYLKQKSSSRFNFPLEGRFALVLKAFSDREKQIFFASMGVLFGTTIILLLAVNRSFMVEVPTYGGTLIEGVLNTPAHINPLLATSEIGSEADRDLTALVYSGLLRADGKNGFIPDLAESYTISPDGLEYTFKLKPNLTWHDGEKITASDIVFTVKTAQDSRTKSNKRASWDGVLVEQIDDLTLRFSLRKPYAPFLENTTLGILPEHIWKTIDLNRFDTNKYNREPIGSGPYKFSKKNIESKNGDDIPVSYTLKAFKSFALGKPYISTIKIFFFRNDDELVQALKEQKVDAINSVSPKEIGLLREYGYRVLRTPLPRVLAVFLNQNQAPIFSDIIVRKALSLSVDKEKIIKTVLAGYGLPLDSAIPSGSVGYKPSSTKSTHEENLATARELLQKNDWKFDEENKVWSKKDKKEIKTLQFNLATSEATELKNVANELKAEWEELGAKVSVQVSTTGDLKETIVRPRKFDALFFGQVLGQGGDPYPFWHSSQRLDPGLNITGYANSKVDTVLEKARTEINTGKRADLYETFTNEISKDIPAIFMYAPEFLYIIPEKVQGISLGAIAIPSERFLNVHKWYTKTDSVWKMFVENTSEI